MNFRRSVIKAELWQPEVPRSLEIFLRFLERQPLTGTFSKFCPDSFHSDINPRPQNVTDSFQKAWPFLQL